MCSACSGDYEYDDTDDLEVSVANPGVGASAANDAEVALAAERASASAVDDALAAALGVQPLSPREIAELSADCGVELNAAQVAALLRLRRAD